MIPTTEDLIKRTDDQIHSPSGAESAARGTQASRPEGVVKAGGGRTSKDFAIEFGGYLAVAAEQFLDALNRTSAFADLSDAASLDEVNDYRRSLRSAVHEFRKRASRAYGEAVIPPPPPNPDDSPRTKNLDAGRGR